MHTLQPKHSILKKEDVDKLLLKFNIALSQLPKIAKKDPSVPEEAQIGSVLKIERKSKDGVQEYFRVIV